MIMKSPSRVLEAGGIKFETYWPGSSPMISPARPKSAPKEGIRTTHTHFAYEAFFVTEGELRLFTASEEQVYVHSVVILPPGLAHFSAPGGNGCYCLLFSFDEGSGDGALLRACLGQGITVLPLAEDVDFYIRRLAVKCEDVTAAARRDAELLTALILNGITAMLLPARKAADAEQAHSHIGAIEKYINNHIRKRITLTDVAKGVYLSPRQTARIIERAYGQSFSEVLNAKRLSAAEALLKSTDMSVAEIAETAFVGSASYFYVCFKAKYGVSPLQYRKRMNKA